MKPLTTKEERQVLYLYGYLTGESVKFIRAELEEKFGPELVLETLGDATTETMEVPVQKFKALLRQHAELTLELEESTKALSSKRRRGAKKYGGKAARR